METLKDDVHIVDTLPADFRETEPFIKTPISWSKVYSALIIEMTIQSSCSVAFCPTSIILLTWFR